LEVSCNQEPPLDDLANRISHLSIDRTLLSSEFARFCVRELGKMADKYDSNGDYGTYADNFKRKSIVDKLNEAGDGENDESNPAAQKAGEYVRELLAEKLTIDQNKQPNACRLIDQGKPFHFNI
jgi:hypothetical protein